MITGASTIGERLYIRGFCRANRQQVLIALRSLVELDWLLVNHHGDLQGDIDGSTPVPIKYLDGLYSNVILVLEKHIVASESLFLVTENGFQTKIRRLLSIPTLQEAMTSLMSLINTEMTVTYSQWFTVTHAAKRRLSEVSDRMTCALKEDKLMSCLSTYCCCQSAREYVTVTTEQPGSN